MIQRFCVSSKKKGSLKYFKVEGLRPCSYHTSNMRGRDNTSFPKANFHPFHSLPASSLPTRTALPLWIIYVQPFHHCAASLTSFQALLLSFILHPWLSAFLYSQAPAFPSAAFGLHVDNPADSAEFSFTHLQVKSAALAQFLPSLRR